MGKLLPIPASKKIQQRNWALRTSSGCVIGCRNDCKGSWKAIGKEDYIDIAFLVTTPMDRHGYFNFGVTCTFLKSIAEAADTVVLVVKEDMPWINGGYDECIHISEVDYIVEDREFPTPFLPFLPPPSKEDEMIAENIIEAGLVENGSTLQVGIGGLPNTVIKMLKEVRFKDLGIHTEMIGDGLMELIEEGIVTNSQKKLDKGKSVFSFALGTRELYDLLDRNPKVATYPVEYTNHPFVIAQAKNVLPQPDSPN